MEDLQQAIADIRASATMMGQSESTKHAAGMAPDAEVEGLLRNLANDFLRADQDLEVSVTGGKNPGLVAGFFDAHFNTPRFIVKTTCKAGSVEVTVADGNWEQLPNQNGLWADWTDERVVFQGEFLEPAIRRGLESFFIAWYRAVKLNGRAGIPIQ
ncbi:hypothetical protein NZD89_25075 [Alicyclobacillus fastidiosus]|uniref:SCP2 domain-containing protein n=1 Tax=Alicyclobacillus fastidiosus TaxID=392011 RepID=A0ABY6ZF49_9BACL|nr:hypothetical protein [Alicyclobacillus fastidiosus]WAH41477.1 hypothetical protein NZD89_25075 [Alicyclobacillus fastidiosus]GMA63118.1 hypothetical protein GCM10025859_35580 [Alicyclobacillus fastidiosus]